MPINVRSGQAVDPVHVTAVCCSLLLSPSSECFSIFLSPLNTFREFSTVLSWIFAYALRWSGQWDKARWKSMPFQPTKYTWRVSIPGRDCGNVFIQIKYRCIHGSKLSWCASNGLLPFSMGPYNRIAGTDLSINLQSMSMWYLVSLNVIKRRAVRSFTRSSSSSGSLSLCRSGNNVITVKSRVLYHGSRRLRHQCKCLRRYCCQCIGSEI